MSVVTEHESEWLYGLRWLARIWSIASIALILLFVFGEEFNLAKIANKELVGFLFFPVGVIVGFIVAWRREGIGGAITIASLLAFYFVYGFLMNGRLWQGGAFIFFAAPGFLFFAYWFFFHFLLEIKVEKRNH